MSSQTEQPLACRLSEHEKEARRSDAEALFQDWLRSYSETDDGYRFEFQSSDRVVDGLFDFVDAERKCCPFFRFDITIEPDDGPVWLEIGGSERVKSFVAEQMIPEVEAAAEA